MDPTIRPEQPGDYSAIYEINRRAFPQEDEARLVVKLRALPDYVAGLSLVAEVDDRLVGHILLSPITIAGPGQSTAALALAPMAVLPEFQNRGIRTALVRRGLEAARRLSHRIVVVVGHPDYHPRFGFALAGRYGLSCPFPVPDAAFLALELTPGALAGVWGTVCYPAPFAELS